MSRFTKVLASIGVAGPQGTFSDWEENSAIKCSVLSSGLEGLLGSSPFAQNEVDMWLRFSSQEIVDAHLIALNEILLLKTFLVGNSISLADYSVFVATANLDLSKFSNVVRWFKHVQSVSKPVPEINVCSVFSFAPTFIPVPSMDGDVSKVPESAATPAASAPASTAAVAVPDNKKAKEGKAKDTDKSKPVPAAAAATEDTSSALDPTKLEIRCGVVLKCWNHPDSEKLLCEEIDMGNGDVRQIASGIRAFYAAEQLVGKKVVVLCNLKERSIGGFKSQGMVLCAVSADHSVIRLLEAPVSAAAGDRVTFPPFPADSVAATPAQMVKKKILEGLAPGLRTDSAGVAHWNDSPFTIGADVCAAPGVADAVVS
eukprot:CAMPEP_0184977080 /NCGR_PEP_ID=MMETSP1098-20130426/7840_1 /TAXON_ID=89044 /ORGANISM="Spumella elongata, Strain CCAP 955/1" /LENGTH=370 /DNA_ID=CAMNT_0027500025 /DNA_START=21 /DNA_END=1133 /DNA_ORIENTATION=-